MEIWLSKLDSTGRSEWTRFFRVFNRYSPFVAIAEFIFEAVSKISGAHYKPSNFLVTQLLNQQFEERLISDGRKRLGF